MSWPSRPAIRPVTPAVTKKSSDADMLYLDVERELEGGIINRVSLTDGSLKITMIDGTQSTYEFYIVPASPTARAHFQVTKEKKRS